MPTKPKRSGCPRTRRTAPPVSSGTPPPANATAPLSLAPDPANPNRMDPDDKARMARSLAEFGDLSGIVINQRTGLLIGGHQRTEVLNLSDLNAEAPTEMTWLAGPDLDGTVARGYITRTGRRYSVRVVDWPPEKAHAALLAANRYGRVGQDDAALLKDLLQELDTGAADMDLTGYTAEAIEQLMTQYHVPEVIDNSADGSTKGANYFDPSGKTAFFAVGEVASPVEYELLKTAEAALRGKSQGYAPEEMRTFMETQLRKLTEAQ